MEPKHSVIKGLPCTTLSTAQLQLGGSKHLCVPVNLRLIIDFFQVYLNGYTVEREALIRQISISFEKGKLANTDGSKEMQFLNLHTKSHLVCYFGSLMCQDFFFFCLC